MRIVNDLVAPGLVTAIDLTSESVAPDWNEWLAYISAAAGYLGAFMGYGGDFVKNFGIASFPWAAKKLYTRIRAAMGTGTTKPLTMRPVRSRTVSRSYQPEFNMAGAKAF